MAILEVSAHIGGITTRMLEAARTGSFYVDRFLRFDVDGDLTVLPHALRAPRPDVGRRATDVIVPRELTRC